MSVSFGAGIAKTISPHEATALAMLLSSLATEAGGRRAAKLQEAARSTGPVCVVALSRPERDALGGAIRELGPRLLPV